MKKTLFLLIICFLFINNAAMCENIELPSNLNPSIIRNNNIDSLNDNAEKMKTNYDINSSLDSKLNNVLNGNNYYLLSNVRLEQHFKKPIDMTYWRNQIRNRSAFAL